MKITREELQAIENHMSNIPAVAGMYTPVLIAWCRALLDNHDDAYRRGAEAMREACAFGVFVCSEIAFIVRFVETLLEVLVV